MGEEILNQVGSEEEFLAMNSIQRKALADSLNVSVAQMSKLVSESGKSADEIGRMRDMDISELVPSETMSNITFVTNKLKELGAVILGKIGAMVNEIDFSKIVAGAEALVAEWLPKIEQFFKDITDKGSDLRKKIGEILPGVQDFKKLLSNLPKILKNIAIAFIGIKLAVWAINLAMAANPIGAIIIGVMALVAAIVLIVQNWDVVKAKLFEFWEWAKAGLLNFGSMLLEGFTSAWEWIKGVFVNVGSLIIDGLKAAATAIFDTITWPYRKAWEWVSSLWGGESPSQVGLSMLTGIQSVEADIEKSLVKPFEAAATKIDATGPGKIGVVGGGTTQMATMKSEINKLNTSLNRLIDNFDKNYIPAIVASNIDGAKKSSREIGRQFQMNAGG